MKYHVVIQTKYELQPRLELEVEASDRNEARRKAAEIYSKSTNDGNPFHFFSPERAYHLVRRASLIQEGQS